MKVILTTSLLLLFVLSCKQAPENETLVVNKAPDATFFNTYKVFDEPGRSTICNLKFYLLVACFSSFDSTHILSIRQDSNLVYGYYKIASNREIPSIQRVIDFDSTSFIYSTIHFKIPVPDIDSLKQWIFSSNIKKLKDSVGSNHLDGGMKEIILFDGEKVFHIYRTFGSDTELETNLRTFIKKIGDNYMPVLPNRRGV